MNEEPVGVRVQRMPLTDQVLVLASIAAGRSEDDTFSGRVVMGLFNDTALPGPAKIANVLGSLRKAGRATPAKAHGTWKLTPLGKQRVAELIGEDAAALLAESLPGGADLGHMRHPLIPASLAPPQLVRPVSRLHEALPVG